MFGNKKFKYHYVSEIDQFLQELNNAPWSKSNSRIEEEQKYKKIFALRDHPQTANAKELAWNDF